MKTVTLFDLSTGAFKRVLRAPASAIERNVPKGFGYKEGRFDPLSQRVDIETNEVVEYRPPQPDADYEWRENVVNGRPRWMKRADVVLRERRAIAAQREIDALERSQLRAIRELAIDPTNETARRRLQEIDAAVAEKALEAGIRLGSDGT